MSIKTRQKYIELGLCSGCGKVKPQEGRRKCAPCAKKENERMKKLREKRKKNGICINCSRPAEEYSTLCSKCKESHAKSKKKMNKEKILNGKCLMCGNDALECKSLCERHYEYKKEYREQRKKFLTENKICYRCGKEKVFGNFKICEKCKEISHNIYMNLSDEKKKEYQNTSYENRKNKIEKEGLCVICLKNKPDEGMKSCQSCLKKRRIKWKAEYEKNGKIKRAERTTYGLCYVCGERLDTGKKLCSKCIENNSKSLPVRGTTKNHTWRNDNRIIYGKDV